MELKEFVSPLRRWWWLILVAALLAGGSTYLVTRRQLPVYAARTSLIVGSTISEPNPTDADFRLSRQLATLYADIIVREPAREAVMTALGITALPRYTVTVPEESQIIEIIVTDTDPQRAQAVANELANQLLLRSPSNVSQEDQARQAFVAEQLAYLESKITETQAEIVLKQDELAEMKSAAQIAAATADLNALESKLSSLQSIYASLLTGTSGEAINTISVVEPAALPRNPVDTEGGLAALVAAVLGLVVGSGAAYLLEYLDDTLANEDDVARVLKLPVIGKVGRLVRSRWDRRVHPEPDLVIGDPHSPHAEAFRTLKTNLDFAGVDKALRSILIASPGPADGKTTVAVNLAVSIARAGTNTLLIDADLRNPSIHRFLGIPNSVGLSEVILGTTDEETSAIQWKEPSLRVVTAGTLPPNPTEVLASRRMDQTLKQLEQEARIVVIDSPPFGLADASLLASKVDGVVLVIRAGHTREGPTRAMLEQLDRAGANVIGVVLNYLGRGGAEYVVYAPEAAAASSNGAGRGAVAALVSRLRRVPSMSSSAGKVADPPAE
jgi:polysaccharide biosynthesis transport protein